jgi:hypothetical protein
MNFLAQSLLRSQIGNFRFQIRFDFRLFQMVPAAADPIFEISKIEPDQFFQFFQFFEFFLFWNLESGIWNLESQIYSSVFFFLRKALPSFDAALLDFFCGFFSAGFSAASALEAARFVRGAAAAPPRFARLLTAGFASTALPSVFAAASCLSLETRIVTWQKWRRSR